MNEAPDDLKRGKQLALSGDYEASLVYLERSVEGGNATAEAWLALAACYFKLNRNDDFRQAIREALLLDPDHEPTHRFLKRITGTETLPMPNLRNHKIYMEEPEIRDPRLH